MRRIIASVLCVISFLIMSPMTILSSEVLADGSTPISFNQTITVVNNDASSCVGYTLTYEYTLTPETENIENAISGVEEGVSLETSTLVFTDLNTNPNQTKTISMTGDATKFTHPGIYRYRLTNTTTEEYRLLDVEVFNGVGGTFVINGYFFYNYDMQKVTEFSDTITFEPDTPTPEIVSNPDTITCNVIFRFIDQNNQLIVDDITFDEVREGVITSTPGKNGINHPHTRINYVLVAVNSSDAYSKYEQVLAYLIDLGYTVVDDEVAQHGNTANAWGDISGPKVYTVHMLWSGEGYDPTLIPPGERSLVPTALVPPLTGDDFNPIIYITTAGVSLGAIITVICLMNRKKIGDKKKE